MDVTCAKRRAAASVALPMASFVSHALSCFRQLQNAIDFRVPPRHDFTGKPARPEYREPLNGFIPWNSLRHGRKLGCSRGAFFRRHGNSAQTIRFQVRQHRRHTADDEVNLASEQIVESEPTPSPAGNGTISRTGRFG